jgi:hypothetical protein
MKSEDLELIKSLTPDRIAQTSDPEIIYGLLGIIISTFSEIAELRQEYQSHREEINRLKGEKGKPEIRKNGGNPGNFSSEDNRKSPDKKIPKGRTARNYKVHINGKKFAQFSKKSFQKMQYSKGILPS